MEFRRFHCLSNLYFRSVDRKRFRVSVPIKGRFERSRRGSLSDNESNSTSTVRNICVSAHEFHAIVWGFTLTLPYKAAQGKAFSLCWPLPTWIPNWLRSISVCWARIILFSEITKEARNSLSFFYFLFLSGSTAGQRVHGAQNLSSKLSRSRESVHFFFCRSINNQKFRSAAQKNHNNITGLRPTEM